MSRVLILCVIALVVIQAAFVQSDCTDGESKKSEDKCNDCYCTKGVWACTRKQCDGPLLTIREKRSDDSAPCAEGASKKVECNSCVCLKGAWACTEMACITKYTGLFKPIPE